MTDAPKASPAPAVIADPQRGQFERQYPFLWIWQNGWGCVYERVSGRVVQAFSGREGLGRWPRGGWNNARWTPGSEQLKMRAENLAMKACDKRNGLGRPMTSAMRDALDQVP